MVFRPPLEMILDDRHIAIATYVFGTNKDDYKGR